MSGSGIELGTFSLKYQIFFPWVFERLESGTILSSLLNIEKGRNLKHLANYANLELSEAISRKGYMAH